jgi:3-dehydroquinate dehydratase-2
MKKIIIINGPNLNLLGNREDDIYGEDSLDKIKSDCEKKGLEKKIEIIFFSI